MNQFSMKYFINIFTFIFVAFIISGCSEVVNEGQQDDHTTTISETIQPTTVEQNNTNNEEHYSDETSENVTEQTTVSNNESGYTAINVDTCNLSGSRQANVVVNIGVGNRTYLAYTNEYGQVVRVVADQIILQDDRTEDVTSSGRYCSDEAKVPGVERSDLDEGHVIADSLGGASNAYNITPQQSTLNRHGDQAYMEESIRKAGGATNFEAIITYPNTTTQIPSHYKYTYTLKGNIIVDEFDNVNPDEINKSLGLTEQKNTNTNTATAEKGDLAAVDTNGNGQVTIAEAKAAGYKMPITRDHWLYQYMDDRDGDGLVGE